MSDRTCCEPTSDAPERENDPGLPELRYRIGTQPTFLRRMIERLPRQPVPVDGDSDSPRPLAALTTRDPSDPTIALLDATASTLDVLTFYQERIFNEGYLRTATERRSILEIARSIGYALNPGVAASAHLAFTVIDAPTAPAAVTVPAGTAVMSVPEGDELPQTFETAEAVEARVGWNSLAVATRKPLATPTTDTDTLWLSGATMGLSVGSPLVVVGSDRGSDTGSERWDLRFVAAIQADPLAGHTRITLDRTLGDERTDPATEDVEVHAFRDRGSLYGYNAPDWRSLDDEQQDAYLDGTGMSTSSNWPGFSMSADAAVAVGAIDLDKEYPRLITGGWVVLQDTYDTELYRVTGLSPWSRTDFGVSAKCVRVSLDATEHLSRFGRRSTVVHLQSEQLTRVGEPWDDAVEGDRVELDTETPDEDLIGRLITVSGVDADDADVALSEVAAIHSLETASTSGRVVLVLEEALSGRYARSSVAINANVVLATHGVTAPDEVLGSGSAATANQSFVLRTPPLTHVSDASPSGASPALEIEVNGVAWSRVDTLYDAEAADRVYTTRQTNEGDTIVSFGDGVRGARLPTGRENVIARYRSGLGLDGEVGGSTLSLMQKRPKGIASVLNPVAASGAADPEALEDARSNAPLTVLTLDRLVSVQDYEDFARAFAGVGKARAVALWDGQRRFVQVTVASASGLAFEGGANTLTSLTAAIAAAQDPTQTALIDTFDDQRFGVALKLRIEDGYDFEDVEAAARAALAGAFGFEARRFGQPVFASEVTSALHGVEGVVAVDIDQLYRLDGAAEGTILPAARATFSGGVVHLAELLRISDDPADTFIEEMSA